MTASTPFVIAIDGPAAAGKGTLARALADHYGFSYLDTGALYRGVAWMLLEAGADPADEARAAAAARAFDIDRVDRAAIRTKAVGAAASVVAAQPRVRQALFDYQRGFAAAPPGGARGAILDGRDIGTVICPDAPVKLFVTASREARAHRRWLELKAADSDLAESAVLEDLAKRDARDAGRADAPMTRAEDAYLLDTSDLSIEAALAVAREIVDAAMNASAP